MTDNHPFSVRILPSALPTTAFRAVENHSRLCHESTIHCVSKPPSPSSATLSIVGNSHYRQRPFHFSKPTFHYEGRLPPYCAGDPHHRRQPSPLLETYRLCEGSLPPPLLRRQLTRHIVDNSRSAPTTSDNHALCYKPYWRQLHLPLCLQLAISPVSTSLSILHSRERLRINAFDAPCPVVATSHIQRCPSPALSQKIASVGP